MGDGTGTPAGGQELDADAHGDAERPVGRAAGATGKAAQVTDGHEANPKVTIVRTWRVQAITSARIAALAVEHDLTRNQSALVDALLDAALDDVDAGRMVIRTVAVRHAIERIERRGEP